LQAHTMAGPLLLLAGGRTSAFVPALQKIRHGAGPTAAGGDAAAAGRAGKGKKAAAPKRQEDSGEEFAGVA
jgi:hypothetical protein